MSTARAVTDLELTVLARALRAHSLRMTSRARTSHVGSCLSVADILAVLYGVILRFDPARPKLDNRDRMVMSKGHAAAVTYAALAEAGFMSTDRLMDFARNGTQMYGHVTHAGVAGVEVSSGSLGHGLPIACGMALTAMRSGASWRTFVVMSDGELDEGSNWEAFLFAAHHRLDNLVVIVDYNGIQSLDSVEKTIGLEPLAAKLQAFGWHTLEVDGHGIAELRAALQEIPASVGKPTFLIARTVKGKGVSWMENQVLWHYRSPDGEELSRALAEVEVAP